MRVRVQIERLVLDGFALSSADGRRVKVALQRELSRLLASEGGTDGYRAGGAVPSVQAGAFDPPPDATPSQLGQHIARSVHAGVRRPQ